MATQGLPHPGGFVLIFRQCQDLVVVVRSDRPRVFKIRVKTLISARVVPTPLA